MRKNEFKRLSKDYDRIERALDYIETDFINQPDLGEIAGKAGLSPYHFQRIFKRWVGISPKQFLQYLTIGYAKRVLEESRSILDATYESGLSSPGRLHDLFVTFDAITPGEYKSGGGGLTIRYGFHPTPFGDCVLAVTDRGICALEFVRGRGKRRMVRMLRNSWGLSGFVEDPALTERFIELVFGGVRRSGAKPITLLLKGTNFQIKTWEALLRIPEGGMVSYQDVARHIGKPRASRAVGNAVGANPVAYLVPCHRVIKGSGFFGNYGGGRIRKRLMLGREAVEAGLELHRT